jgi:O-antigen/teichoic acid export membrane protein
VKKLLLKNSLFGVYQSLLSSILFFIAISIFIKYLGSEKYGIFALYLVIGNLNILVSGGFSSPIVKYVSKQGISNESSLDITAGFFILAILSLFFLIIFFVFDTFIIINILNIPESIYFSTVWLYYWLILANSILLIGQVFKAIIDGLQKSYITSIHLFIYNLIYWLFIIIGLILGADLNIIGFLVFISALIWFIITFVTSRVMYGSFFYFDTFSAFKDSIRKQLSFGSKIFLGSTLFIFFEPLSKILVSHYMGIAYVGYYDIAIKLKGQAAALFARLYYPLFPFFSKENNPRLISFYVKDIEQKSFILLTPIIISIIFLLEPLVDIWLGNNEVIYISAFFLVLSQLLFSTTVTPIYIFLTAQGYEVKTVYIQLLNTIINISFFLLSFSFLGYYAIILGNSLALLGSFALCTFYQYKYLNNFIFDSFLQFLLFLSVSCTLFVFSLYVYKFVSSLTFLQFLIIPICNSIFFFCLCSLTKLITSNDVIRYIGNNRVSSFINKFMRS